MLNIEHYRLKILTNADKEKYRSKIRRNVRLVFLVMLLMFLLVIMLFGVIISGVLDDESSGWFLGAFYGLFCLMMFIAVFVDKNDVMKKYMLNEKIFLLFSFLKDELEQKSKLSSKWRVNYIITRIVRNLYILEGNLSNRFIFLHNSKEIELVKKIIVFSKNDLRSLVKDKKFDEVKIVIQMLNELYGYSILRELVSNSHDEEQAEAYRQKLVEFETALVEISSLKDSSEKKGSTVKRLIDVIQTKWFKFVMILLLTAGLFLLMILYKDVVYIPAIVTVLGLSFAAIQVWVLQSNNDSSNKGND